MRIDGIDAGVLRLAAGQEADEATVCEGGVIVPLPPEVAVTVNSSMAKDAVTAQLAWMLAAL